MVIGVWPMLIILLVYMSKYTIDAVGVSGFRNFKEDGKSSQLIFG